MDEQEDHLWRVRVEAELAAVRTVALALIAAQSPVVRETLLEALEDSLKAPSPPDTDADFNAALKLACQEIVEDLRRQQGNPDA